MFAEWLEGRDLPDGLLAATSREPPVPVVVLVPQGHIATAARARTGGATDVPFYPPEAAKIRAEIEDLQKSSEYYGTVDHELFWHVVQESLVGESPKFRKCVDEMRLAAAADANVLLAGPTGTGKEMFARTIHRLSRRCKNPYVGVNCASLAANLLESELFGHGKGAFTDASKERVSRFEAAGAGTLLLDEIGDIDVRLPVKLLRAIEQRSFQRVGQNDEVPFHARLICATSIDLDQAVREGRFRPDLLGRINQFRITLPALRERDRDVRILIRHFLGKHSRGCQLTVSRTAFEILEAFDFPMNVRQLENAIVEAIARSGDGSVILPEHLPAAISTESSNENAGPSHIIHVAKDMPYEKAREFVHQELDKVYLPALLAKHSGNRNRAAEEAKIDRKTLWHDCEVFKTLRRI